MSSLGSEGLGGRESRPLTSREIEQLKRLLSDPFNYPPELWNWIKAKIEDDPPGLTWEAILGFSQAVARSTRAWLTGDTKVSAQAATHPDPAGGTWYLADGSAIPGGEAALIALLGANLPDARGRALTMKGTHVDVDAIGDSDGVAVGSRRPSHKHTVAQPAISRPAVTITDPGHFHTGNWGGVGASGAGTAPGPDPVNTDTKATGVTAALASDPVATGGTVGPQTGAEPVDAGAYVVPGNLFYHS